MSVQEQDKNTEAKTDNVSVEKKTDVKVESNTSAESTSSTSATNTVETKVDTETVESNANTPNKTPDKPKKETDTMNWVYVALCLLVIVSLWQYRQINSLQKDNVWLSQQLTQLANKPETKEQKFVIMSFDDTVKAWQAIDPSGESASKILSQTVKSYNEKGYTILDSTAVIGGKGNIEFIDVSPNRYAQDGDK
ncbi:hypothetical protein [Vibrio sp. 10N.239.312.D08]|uniref:hypothetical protein n=1 Tax=Vibrio sp. 10N.239.312.D08 TaxID=3229978 RepID=UPI00354BB313